MDDMPMKSNLNNYTGFDNNVNTPPSIYILTHQKRDFYPKNKLQRTVNITVQYLIKNT